MFDFIRTHQRLMQLVLLVLILPSFALIGISGYTSYVSGDHDLVEIGSGSITRQEFDLAHRDQLQRLQSALGTNFDPAVHDTVPMRQELLDGMIARRVLAGQLAQHHFSVSDRAVKQAIGQIPDFQEDGVFSEAQYAAVLTGMGMTGPMFEENQRGELALRRVLGPVGSTVQVPDASVDALMQSLTEERVVRVRRFLAADHQAGVTVDEAQIQAWYDANQQALSVPESVNVEYLVLDEAAAMQDLPAIVEADLQAYFEQNQARFVQPARSRVNHIQWLVPAGASDEQKAQIHKQAQEVAAQAAADPTQFAQLAQTHSQDAGTASNGGLLGWITRGTWPTEIENAVFGLQAGQVSSVVEVSGNYHVFFIAQAQPEQRESFEQVRPQLEQEVKRQLASNRYSELATRLTDLVYEDSSSLTTTAQTLNLTLRRARGIAADQLLPAGRLPAAATDAQLPVAADSADAELLNTPRLRRELFAASSLRDRQNTGVIEISTGVMVAARVASVVPAHVQALDSVRDFIRSQLLAEHARRAAQQAGEAALATLREAAADAATANFSAPLRISRLDPQSLSADAVKAVFAAEKIPSLLGVTDSQGYTLVRLDAAVQPAEPNPAIQDALRAQINQALALAEQRAVLAVMREQAKVKILPEAQRALEASQEDGA